MGRLCHLLAAACGVAAALALAAPQARADSFPIGAATLQGQHFMVHYTSDYTKSAFLPQAKAGDVLGWAERAYALYSGWSFTSPAPDTTYSNGLNNIVVEDFASYPEPTASYTGFVTSQGVIHLDVKKGTNAHAVAHEVFVLFEWQTFHAPAATWFEEASAEWAAYAVEQFLTPTEDSLGEPDRTIDCLGGDCGYNQAANPNYDSFYDRDANPGWSFFEYLNEKYGTAIMHQIWLQAAADGAAAPATQPIDEVLATKGTSLSSAFDAWITARLNGDFQLVALRGVLPQVFTNIATGGVTLPLGTPAPIPATIVAVNHLAARYVELDPGDGTTAPCYAATLDLSVTIPSGVTSTPYLYVSPSAPVIPPPAPPPTAAPTLITLTPPQALTLSGNTASISVPWSTCTGGAAAYLSLPNATVDTKVNGNEFTIAGNLTVNTKVPGAPNLPPTPVKVSGTTVSSPTSAVVPTIDLFGPDVIHLSGSDTSIQLAVRSDTDGKLQAALGSYALGTATLRTGGNNLVFALPPGALTSLRRAASTNTLTLTPYSTSGTAGTPVTRAVQIDSTPSKVTAKAKTKKQKAKKQAKARGR
jgi:hypothetical protein